MSNEIEQVFAYTVGIWAAEANAYGEHEPVRIFGDVEASDAESAIAAFPEAAGLDRVSAMPIHYVAAGLEYDFR